MSLVSSNAIRVKQINVELVKNTLRTMEFGTKLSIASVTGLSVATCGNILNELLHNGEVVEMELEESSGGRPARRYRLNANFSCVVCLFVKTGDGVNSMTYVVANLIGEMVEKHTVLLEKIDYDSIDKQIGELIERHGNIKAIGIGIPGVVLNDVVDVCDIPELSGQALGPRLKEKYGLEVVIENDMNLTVYGFYFMQNFDADRTFGVVTLSKGHLPGAGFIVNGNILKGNTHFAGEVSFLPYGMTRQEQLSRSFSPDDMLPVAIDMMTSIIAIINPVSIALTGELPSSGMLEQIYQGCLAHIPQEHMPEFFVKNDTDDEYMHGLVSMTLECLVCNLQLVDKRIQ